MSERFLKFIPSEEAFWLMTEKPNAFRLLAHIANTARRINGYSDGLIIGQCHLQHWTFYKLTEREYRTAKEILVKQKHIIIVETNRTRKKSTTGATTASTLVQLCRNTIFDINPDDSDDWIDDRATTERRPSDDKQEGIRRNKNEKESHPSVPSQKNGRMTDDFSLAFKKVEVIPGIFMTQSDLEVCIKIKGSIENVKDAVTFIQNSKRRKHDIIDWPNALAKWKIENKVSIHIEDNLAYAQKLCKEFPDYKYGNGVRCSTYHDKKKDQKGVLFETESVYQEAVFISYVDGEFQKKCEEYIKKKKMRKTEVKCV